MADSDIIPGLDAAHGLARGSLAKLANVTGGMIVDVPLVSVCGASGGPDRIGEGYLKMAIHPIC